MPSNERQRATSHDIMARQQQLLELQSGLLRPGPSVRLYIRKRITCFKSQIGGFMDLSDVHVTHVTHVTQVEDPALEDPALENEE